MHMRSITRETVKNMEEVHSQSERKGTSLHQRWETFTQRHKRKFESFKRKVYKLVVSKIENNLMYQYSMILVKNKT